ncbi:MAG TPA: TonB-dependent receptor [Terriglobales bacterium]|nr:TonB-dependent receptor [Terriglobales bacterium]
MRSLFVFVWLAVSAWGAVPGAVRGIVHDPQHRPIPGALLRLRAVHAPWRQSASSDANGEFRFSSVPLGAYTLTASHPGFRTVRQALVVAAGQAPILHLELPLAAVSQSTTVTASAPLADVASSTPTTTVTRLEVARTPGADRTNSLAAITDFVPGAYMVHDQLHVRGGHQVSWLVDGVPVPNTNIASNVGPQFDPKDMHALQAQRGSYDAEYGDRTYGVFNVVPRTGFSRNRQAELVLSAGSFGQTNDQLNLGSHTDRFAYYASLSGNRSALGLETPTAQVLHDADNGLGGFQSLLFNLDPKDQWRVVASERRDFYQIPNTPAQDTAAQHDAQREADAYVNFSWVRTLSPSAVLTVSPLYHYNAADYRGGPNDFPLSTTDDRSSQYAGAQAVLNASTARNSLALGFYGFAQRDQQFFGLRFNDGSQPNLSQNQPARGQLEEEFLEEKFQPWSWLTLMGGLRQSHFRGSLAEDATSPRLGLALALPRLHWVLRGNYGRYYQPPPLVTASGPLLQFVTGQNLGFIPLRGERDQEWQVGLTLPLRGWALDGDYFHNRARNFFDHNNIGNSDLFFPLTIAAARVYGFEATLRSPRLWNRGQVHLAYSNQIAEGAGAVSGGLTDFSPPQGWFLLDHDQRNTLDAGADLNLPGAAYLSANLYFGSGFANGNAPPAHLPGHAEVDLTLGKPIAENLSIAATVLNLANCHLLTDNSLTFGGTHWNSPRQVYLELRYRFRY